MEIIFFLISIVVFAVVMAKTEQFMRKEFRTVQLSNKGRLVAFMAAIGICWCINLVLRFVFALFLLMI